MPPSHFLFCSGPKQGKLAASIVFGDAFASIGRPLKLAATNESKAGQAFPPLTFSISQPNLSPAGPTKFHRLISSFSARYRPDATNGDTLHRSYFCSLWGCCQIKAKTTGRLLMLYVTRFTFHSVNNTFFIRFFFK
jgi:hypothetical protein